MDVSSYFLIDINAEARRKLCNGEWNRQVLCVALSLTGDKLLARSFQKNNAGHICGFPLGKNE